MALGTPLRTFEHKYFLSINDRDDAQSIPDYYAANIENWVIRNVGEIEMRDGLTAKGTNPGATNLGCVQLKRPDGSIYLYRVISGAANTSKFQYSTNGTTWTDMTSGGSKSTTAVWVFVQANNYVYGVNGTDTAVRLDAATITTISAIPKGRAIEWYKNHLMVMGVDAVPDRLYVSDPDDPETFGATNYFNISAGDNSKGVGLRAQAGQGGRLYIGKERSVHYLAGTSIANFAINPLTFEHGVASHESMVQVKNDVWCIDLDGNIRGLYRTEEDNPFSALRSKYIQSTIAGLNKTAITNTTAIYFDNFAMFFVPNGVDSQNSLVLVHDSLANFGKGGWTKFTSWNIARAVVFNQSTPQLYLFDSRTGNGQAYQWDGTSDNGSAIVAKYETKIYDHGFVNQRKKFKFAYQLAPVLGSVSVRFYSSIDRFYYTLLKTFNLSGTGNPLWNVAQWGVDQWGSGGFVRQKIKYVEGGGTNKGYTQQIKLEAESSTTKLKLRLFTSHYRVRGLR